jgi:hypothetical protein
MRTKTMLLSALLGTLGSVSLMAQSTNVYSQNAVGYINVTIQPGFNIVSCPLICSPDNTLNTLMPNASGLFKGWSVYFNTKGQGYTQTETGAKTSWASGGTNVISPGSAVFVRNTSGSNVTVTFVGQVPQGLMTNVLVPGFNLVGSIVPTSGNLVTNPITQLTNAVKGDTVYVSDPINGYTSPGGTYVAAKNGGWATGQPVVPNVAEGFFYQNNNGVNLNWVENFSVNP